jgi:hypothetical protein
MGGIITTQNTAWLALLLCTKQVPDPNLRLETGYHDRGFRGFPQYLEVNARLVRAALH